MAMTSLARYLHGTPAPYSAEHGDDFKHFYYRQACDQIEIEIVYNMYRMRRFFTKSRMRRLLSLGPLNYAIQGTYKSGLDR
jgi:hypothetical protein